MRKREWNPPEQVRIKYPRHVDEPKEATRSRRSFALKNIRHDAEVIAQTNEGVFYEAMVVLVYFITTRKFEVREFARAAKIDYKKRLGIRCKNEAD